MEVEYEENVHPEKSFELRTGKYAESESDREGDVKEIKRLFAKPYEETFLENKSILQEFFEYLKKNKIRTLVYFPPFPDIFKKNTDITMKRRTRNVIREFQKKYNFDVLDLTEDDDFSDEFFCDWSHLNWLGANLATEKINAYMNKIWI